MKLKEFIRKNPFQTFLIASIAVSMISILSFGFLYRSLESEISTLENLRNGANICASRVAQTQFALLSGVTSAQALASEYLGNTDECFYQFDNSIEVLTSLKLAPISRDFYDEFINYKNMVRNFDTGSVPLTRVINSYEKIEEQKYSIGVKLTKKIDELLKSQMIQRYAILFSIILLGGVIISFLMNWKKRDDRLKNFEADALLFRTDYAENALKVERLLERIFDQLKLPAVKDLFLEYNTYMLEKAYPDKKAIEYSEKQIEAPKAEEEIDDEYLDKVFESMTTSKENQEKIKEIFVDESIPVEGELAEEIDQDEEVDELWSVPENRADNEHVEVQLVNDFHKLIEEEDEERIFETLDINSIPDEEEVEAEIIQDEAAFELKQISAKVKEILGDEALEQTKEKEDASDQSVKTEVVQDQGALIEASKEESQEEEKSQGVAFQEIVKKLTKAVLKRESGIQVHWEFSSDYQDFKIVSELESIEQIVHCMMSRFDKGFNDLKLADSRRVIKVAPVVLKRKSLSLEFSSEEILFNTAELEFLNHAEQSVRKLIDRNLIMTQELVKGLGGDIILKNELGESNSKRGVLCLKIPKKFTNKTSEKGKPFISRIVRGTKEKIVRTLSRENTV